MRSSFSRPAGLDCRSLFFSSTGGDRPGRTPPGACALLQPRDHESTNDRDNGERQCGRVGLWPVGAGKHAAPRRAATRRDAPAVQLLLSAFVESLSEQMRVVTLRNERIPGRGGAACSSYDGDASVVAPPRTPGRSQRSVVAFSPQLSPGPVLNRRDATRHDGCLVCEVAAKLGFRSGFRARAHIRGGRTRTDAYVTS